MTARQSVINQQFENIYSSRFKNLFVNGCSYTWNNSESVPVTWPYYLRDLAKIDNVYDCSQGASGANHIFTSTVYEIETSVDINKDDTLIVIMWSGLSRVDLIAKSDIDLVVNSTSYPGYSFWRKNRYTYFDNFLSLPLIRNSNERSTLLEQMSLNYFQLIDIDTQIIASATKLLALHEYLKNKGFNFVFLTWEKKATEIELSKLPKDLANAVRDKIHNIKTLGEYADEYNLRVPNDGHPTPDAHLHWTKEYLIPHLESIGYLEKI